MSSLAKQLKELQIPGLLSATTRAKASKRASLLFDPKEAAGIDTETVYSLGLNGLEGLKVVDHSFSAFERSLFSESTKSLERTVQSKEANEKLDKQISKFLQYLSPYVMLKPAHKALEWLIRRFQIHVFNADGLLTCILPYHETNLFARVLQLLSIGDAASRWHWLHPVQKAGVPLSKTALLQHCISDFSFLALICDMVSLMLQSDIPFSSYRVLVTFYTSTIVGSLELMGSVSEKFLSFLLPRILEGLRSEASELVASSYMITAQLCSMCKMKEDLVKSLLDNICKHINSGLATDGLCCLTCICQLQSVKKLSKRSLKALVSVPWLVKTASQLSSSHDISPLLRVFLLQLISTGLKNCVTQGHSAPATVDTLLATAHGFVQEIDLDKDLVVLIGRALILGYSSARDKLGASEKALQGLNANVKDLIQLLEKRYPVELEKAIGEHLASVKASKEMGDNSPSSTHDQASMWTMELVSLALAGVKSQVIVDSNTTLVLSLHHPRPEVREMAVNRLGQLLNRKENLSEDAHFVGESLLNRLQDEDPTVVASVLTLEQVLVKNVSGSQLVEQLIKLLSSRSPQWNEIREKSSILLTSNWVTCAVPSLTDQVVFGLLPFLFLHQHSQEMVLSLLVTVSNSALESQHPLLCGVKNVVKTKEWMSCAKTSNANVLAAANNVLINWLGGNLVAMEEKSRLQLVHRMTKHAKELPEDSFFHLMLQCMLGRAIAMATEKCKLALCNVFAELLLPDVWKITKLQGSYMNELTEGVDSEPVHVDSIPEPLLISLVRLLNKQSTRRIVHARAAITLRLCKNVMRNMPAVASASSGEWWFVGKPDSPENTYTKLLLLLLEVLAFGSISSTSHQVAFKGLLKDLLEIHLENEIDLLKFLAYVWSAQICKVHDQTNSPRITVLLQVQCLHIANVCFTSLSGKIVKQLIKSTCAVIPSLLIPLCSPITAVRRSAVSCVKSLGTQFTTVQCCPVTTLMSVLTESKEELAADPGHLHRVFTEYFAPLMPSHELHFKCPTHTKTVNQTLAFILRHIVSDTTPPQVSRILLSSLSGFVTQDMLKTLMPLLSDLLDQCGGAGSDFSEDHSIILLLIVKKFTSDTAALLQSGSQPWKVLLRLLTMRKAVYRDHPSPILGVLEQISNRFFQAIPTEEQQQHLLKLLLDVLIETKDFLVGNSIKDTIMKLSLTADQVTEELLHLKTRHESEPKKKKLKKAHPASDHDHEIHHQLQRSTVVLELLQHKINIVDQHRLVPALFAVLRRCTEVDHSQSSSDYIMQLTFSVINSICQKLSPGGTSVSTDHLPENQFDVELIVQCIRSSESPQTHNQALLLLATAAKLFPEKVLHNVMSIFTFMGASILRQDDSYSFQVITKTLDTVIPALIQAGENQQLPQQRNRDPVSLADVVNMLIRVFVDASPHIPEHRQLPLFTHLVNTVGSRQFLYITLILLLERHVLHGSALSQEKEALTAPSSQLGTDFCLRLLHSFYPDVQVDTMLKLLQYVDGLPLEKPEGRHKPRIGRKTTRNFPLVTPLFDVDTHSAKHLRQFKYVSLSLIPTLLGSEGFVNKVRDQENKLNSLFMRLLEENLNFVTKTAQHAENMAQETTGKFWKALLHRAYDIIDKVNVLLEPSVFFGVIRKLLQSNNPTVRRKAMELLNSTLNQGTGNYGENQDDALLALVTELLIIAGGTGESDESMVNRQTALYSLKLLSRHLASKHPNQFKEVISEAIQMFSVKDANIQVACSAVLCVAEAVSVLQAHAIPFLPKLVPSVLKLLRKTGKDRSGLLALCGVTALLKTTEALPHFLSPYLVDILFQVTNPSIAGGADLEGHGEQGVAAKLTSVQAQLRERLESLRKELSTKISPRVLITAVSQCYDELIDKQKESVGILMCLLADCINGMSKENVKLYQSQLFNLFLAALDFRSHFSDKEHDNLVETTEGSVIEAFLSLVVKLSEATFRPMFLRAMDWAVGNSASKDRLLVFYRLCDSVAGKLKGLFVLFAGYIVKNCSSLLNATNSSKTEECLFPNVSKERGIKKSCILLSYLLDCLHKCVLYDSHGFLDSDRFQCLMQPLVDQIDNLLGGEEMFRERLSDHLVPCLSQFAAASGNDAHWKPLNFQVLLKTRHSSALVRFAALKVLEGFHSRLGEDFMVLLPETIPFLAELMEDECFEVEQQCQHVISEIEQVLGESLQKYF